MISVSDTVVTEVAKVPPTRTRFGPAPSAKNPEPVIVMVVPPDPGPWAGETPVTVRTGPEDPLDPPPQEQQIPYVQFFLGDEEVPLVDDCMTEDGWVWTDVGFEVEFCGSYCDDFKNGVAMFDGVYGCPIPD